MFMTVPQGSPLHCARALEHPRWEDYIFEPLDNVKNRFYWLGDGHTVADRAKDGDSKHVFFYFGFIIVTIVTSAEAWYLNEIDYPPGKRQSI
jgi:hypothetical protein